MKYFFLSEGWAVGRIWTVGGLWSETAWRRAPDIEKMNLCILDKNERMWLHRVEEAVLMVEIYPTAEAQKSASNQNIGNVVLTRLINSEKVLEYLCTTSAICQIG
ncbi:MAG: hypothetical protein F6K54_08395 [Okeania sp. SIO3B5]|uniref:hypothetical protein n=1 Tax=Okeania sp. SIO3B5 TaxID=2607811 RepID=UPI0013FEEFF3|nr:hypothetical protein [Okeania sp. SIO3B5]NEO53096.1 hypothetical protein [Okeania sp. SIO3B5]